MVLRVRMRRSVAVSVLGVSVAFFTALAGTAAAQPVGATTEATSTSAAAQTASISGTVYDARPLDGPGASQVVVPSGLQPVAGATVSVPSQRLTTLTDSSGHYDLSGLSVSGAARRASRSSFALRATARTRATPLRCGPARTPPWTAS